MKPPNNRHPRNERGPNSERYFAPIAPEKKGGSGPHPGRGWERQRHSPAAGSRGFVTFLFCIAALGMGCDGSAAKRKKAASRLPERLIRLEGEGLRAELLIWHGSPDWRVKSIRMARGDYLIPRGAEAQLLIDRHISPDLSFLDRLQPNDLQHISLRYGGLTPDDVDHLQTQLSMSFLDLRKIRPDPGGLEALKTLTSVRELYIKDVPLTDDDVEHLEAMTSLKFLGILNSRMTMAAIQRLKKALPDCQILTNVPGANPPKIKRPGSLS